MKSRLRLALVALACGLLVALPLACGGAQHPADSQSTVALASIHGAAHILVVTDGVARDIYVHRTDAIAGDGGPRGAAYVAATADLDNHYRDLVRALSVSSNSLALAETFARQAQAAGDAPSQCRAGLAIDDAVSDLAPVAAELTALGAPVDPAFVTAARGLAAQVAPLVAHCDGPASDAGGGQ